MRTNPKFVSAIGALVLAGSIGLTACSGSDEAADSAGSTGDSASQGATQDSGAGFEEFPVGDDKHIEDQVNVAVVYFQPVDMKPAGMALPAAEASFHLEADASGLEGNTLGYGTGDFVPGLTIDYKIADKASGQTKAEGTFMQMNASDGPHYGANISLPDAGEYTLTLKVHSPAENGWVLHSDPETGVKGDFWTQPAELSWDWNYTPQEW